MEKIDTKKLAQAIIKKPNLLGKALLQANCKRREARLQMIIEMRLASKRIS